MAHVLHLSSSQVELLLPSGRVRVSHGEGFSVPAGSRAVADPQQPGQVQLGLALRLFVS